MEPFQYKDKTSAYIEQRARRNGKHYSCAEERQKKEKQKTKHKNKDPKMARSGIRTERKASGDDSREALRNRGHSQRNSDLEIIDGTAQLFWGGERENRRHRAN